MRKRPLGSNLLEDTGDTNVDAVLVHVSVGKGLGDTLSLVVTSSDTGTVDVTPAVITRLQKSAPGDRWTTTSPRQTH